MADIRLNLFEMMCGELGDYTPDYPAATIRHRDTAQKLLADNAQPGDSIVINFDRIDFATRAFLHELLYDAYMANITLTFENACDDVKMMAGVVIRNSETLKCSPMPF